MSAQDGAKGSAFHVGQAVRMLNDASDPPSEDSPGGIYARRGERLIVKRIGSPAYPFPIRLAHEDRNDGKTFGVEAREIEPWDSLPNSEASDQTPATPAKEVKPSPASTCIDCGRPIRNDGQHWVHADSSPRHPARPQKQQEVKP